MINSIKASNFLSWKQLNFEVKKGITLIDGFNRDDNTPEGSGKSAVLNAIAWGLYGKIPKDANIDDVIKSGEKSTKVIVTCDDFEVVRCRKPNEIFIVKGKEKLKGKDARETQSMIEDLIGMSFDTFCQTIYFAQNYPKKFITATQEDKGKILSEVQDLHIFDKARKETTKLIKIENQNVHSLELDLQKSEMNIEAKSDQLNDFKQIQAKLTAAREEELKYIDSQILELSNRIKSADSEIDVLNNSKSDIKICSDDQISNLNTNIDAMYESISDLNNKRKNIKSHNMKLNTLKCEETRYGTDISRLVKKVKELKDFINNPNKSCPTCGSHLETQDTTQAENEVTKLGTEIAEIDIQKSAVTNQINNFEILNEEQINADISKLNESLTELKNQINKNNENVSKVNNINSRVESIVAQIKQTNTDIETLQSKRSDVENQPVQDYSDKIESIKLELDDAINLNKTVRDLYDEKLNYINRLETLSIGFKQVKSYTFNTLLSELTIKTNKYLQELFEVPITLKFENNNMKISCAINYDGIDRSLGLLSGGQFRRTSLAVDLALSEIVASRNSSKLNIRCLDEYFKDLSESSMEKCLRLLEKLGGSTILIEHNSIFKSIVNNVFECELVNGTTRSVA